jgi:uncharacterized protein (DUF1330 family)
LTQAAVGATIVQYGGRFLARAGATELIEGGPEPKRIVRNANGKTPARSRCSMRSSRSRC